MTRPDPHPTTMIGVFRLHWHLRDKRRRIAHTFRRGGRALMHQTGQGGVDLGWTMIDLDTPKDSPDAEPR